MNTFKNEVLDLILGKSEEVDGKFYIIGQALTQDYECEKGLNILAGKLINRDFTWRHRHPLQEKHKENHVYGIVREASVDESLMVKAELYNHTEDHRKLIAEIKIRDLINEPLSLSMHYRTYSNEEGVKVHYDVFELAGTPYPHCKICKITNTGVMKMGDEENEKKKKELEKEKLKKENTLEKALKVIAELEKELNSKTKTLEGFESKIKKLESDMSDKEDDEKTSEDKLLELEDKVDFLENKKPILDKILEADTDIDKDQLEWLKTKEVSYLEGRLEKAVKKAESKIVVMELAETAKKAQIDKEKEEKGMEEVSYEQFISQIGPIKKQDLKKSDK